MRLPGPGPSAAEAAATLLRLSRLRPKLAIVLGSGFHRLGALLKDAKWISYARVPGFGCPGVAGHAGRLGVGRLGGTAVYLLSGRTHYYEGYPAERITFPMRALAEAGLNDVMLTNAAGGVNPAFCPGDFMVVTDHINLMGFNPLRRESGASMAGATAASVFVDLSAAYDAGMRKLLLKAARAQGMRLRQGVYLAVSGPSYETPAEIRAFARLGADAVGMSTVPETIVARSCGLRVAALSCITNMAAGITKRGEGRGLSAVPVALSHADVLAMAEQVGTKGAKLLEAFARLYGKR